MTSTSLNSSSSSSSIPFRAVMGVSVPSRKEGRELLLYPRPALLPFPARANILDGASVGPSGDVGDIGRGYHMVDVLIGGPTPDLGSPVVRNAAIEDAHKGMSQKMENHRGS